MHTLILLWVTAKYECLASGPIYMAMGFLDGMLYARFLLWVVN